MNATVKPGEATGWTSESAFAAPVAVPAHADAPRRSLRIDTLRGLACVMLVTYHVIGGNSDGLRLPEGHPLRTFDDWLLYIRMPLFSFLSGFVYSWRPFGGDYAQFVADKARRLIVPMLLVGTAFAIIQSHTPGTHSQPYVWKWLHIVPVAHYWFLESLFLVFMIIAGLESSQWLHTQRRFAFVWLAAAALQLTNSLPVYFGLWGAAYLLPYTLLGLWCSRFSAHFTDERALIVSAAAVLGAIACALLLSASLPQRNSVYALVIGVGACIFLLRLRLQWPWLAWIGRRSFSIYLFHSMFSAASRIVLYRVGDIPVPILLVAGLSSGLYGPIMAQVLLRRFPSMGSWVLGESPRRLQRQGALR